MYAAEIGLDGFTGSNGWLQKWQKCHNVHMSILSGEAANVNPDVESDWKAWLKTIVKDMHPRTLLMPMKLAFSLELCQLDH